MWITKAGYRNLLNKSDELEIRRKNLLKELGDQADRDSDLPENPIWKQLQVELRFNLPKAKSDLQKIISEAQIIEDILKSQLDNQSKVRLGSKVKIKLDDKEKIFVLVGPYDTNTIQNGISYISPLGKTLLGAEAGEEKEFIAPKGKSIVSIVSIERGL